MSRWSRAASSTCSGSGRFWVARCTPADEKAGAENVIVLEHGLWQRRYGGSREVIGRRVMLGEQPFTIVGVMPPDLDYPAGVEVWRTTSSVPTDGPFGDAARREVNLIGRLRPGVTLEQATTRDRRVDRAAGGRCASQCAARSHSRRSSVRGRGRRRRPDGNARAVRRRRARAADCERECGEPLVDAWRGAAGRARGARRTGGRTRQNRASGAWRKAWCWRWWPVSRDLRSPGGVSGADHAGARRAAARRVGPYRCDGGRCSRLPSSS